MGLFFDLFDQMIADCAYECRVLHFGLVVASVDI
jgi:hypothetical protein